MPDEARSLFRHSEVQENGTIPLGNQMDLGRSLWRETITALWPDKRFYPGWRKTASAVTGYKVDSVKRWKYVGTWVPIPAAKRIRALLAWEINVRQQLLIAWDKYIAEADIGRDAKPLILSRYKKKDIFD